MYTKEQLETAMIDDNAIRFRFGKGETGWAYSLGDGLAIIGNIPMEGLHFMDVVKVVEEDGWSTADDGEVVFRYYPSQMVVDYEPKTRERYAEIKKALEAAGLAVEGFIEGMAGLACFEDSDVLGVLKEAGVSTEGIELRWEEEP